MRNFVRLRILVLALCVGFCAADAEAIPLLQLDMAGGTYDPATQSIVAPNGPFSLYAVLTPQNNTSASQLQALLDVTYYISVAITPQVHTATPLGSFTFGQTGSVQTISATSGMTYGNPPIEDIASAQGHDGHDLAPHGMYPTYFVEFAFTFSATDRTVAYNSQDDPGGLTPSAAGAAYFATFVGDTSALQSGYNLHFDLYNTVARRCSLSGVCADVDADDFAPFSHDAQTYTPPTSVPEPATGLLILAGMASLAASRRRRARA